jgi:hypothetical protein
MEVATGDAGNGIASRASREVHWKGSGVLLCVCLSSVKHPKHLALGI